MDKIEVFALEYEALQNLDRIVRAAMQDPDVGPLLVASVGALDAVRADIDAQIEEARKRGETLLDKLMKRM